jgi:hypothetical protein
MQGKASGADFRAAARNRLRPLPIRAFGTNTGAAGFSQGWLGCQMPHSFVSFVWPPETDTCDQPFTLGEFADQDQNARRGALKLRNQNGRVFQTQRRDMRRLQMMRPAPLDAPGLKGEKAFRHIASPGSHDKLQGAAAFGGGHGAFRAAGCQFEIAGRALWR